MNCITCGKESGYANYCDWDCHVAYAKAQGGKEHLPNGLPIRCIKNDGTMYEHEHGDHADYKFPIDIEHIGVINEIDREEFVIICGRQPVDDEEVRNLIGQTHALIYTDGGIAVTMYECCYGFWYVKDGRLAGGSLWGSTRIPEWKISDLSLQKIREYLTKNSQR